MTVEAARHATADVLRDVSPTFLPPQEIPLPTVERKKPQYEYLLQQRIATEWANLLGEDFTPATNVVVFKDKVEQLRELAKDPNAKREDVLRLLSYIKIGAISIATSYGKNIHGPVEKKLELMQEKYPPTAVTELRNNGYNTKEACLKLKNGFENGIVYQNQGIEISQEEYEARMPRYPAFRDPFQDFSDTWARASYGKDLASHDSMAVVLNETEELVAEFDEEEHIILDSRSEEENLELIIGEVADVIISGDGKFSEEEECVDKWQNFALDRMIDTYGDLPKLRRMGVPTQIGMHYLRECRHRDERGLSRPISPVQGYRGPHFRITSKVPPERDFSSEMLH